MAATRFEIEKFDRISDFELWKAKILFLDNIRHFWPLKTL